MNPFYKNLALWMVIGLIVILLFNLFQANQSPRGEIVFSDFLKKVDTGDVREVTLRGNAVTGRLSDGSAFRTFTADYPDLVKALKDRGRDVWYLLAENEGHGFKRKENQDFATATTVLFFRQKLLGETHAQGPSSSDSPAGSP